VKLFDIDFGPSEKIATGQILMEV